MQAHTPPLWEAAYPAQLRNYSLDTSALPINAAALAETGAQQFAEQPACCFVLPTGASTYRSFREINALSDAFAAFLIQEMGLQPGVCIALQMPTCMHYPIALFGAWKAGLVVTNVNPLYTERELRLQLQDSGAQLLVVADMFLQSALPVAQALGVRTMTASLWDFFEAPIADAIRSQMPLSDDSTRPPDLLRVSDVLVRGAAMPRQHRRDHSVALYQYTGGTTGRSKGAIITHQNILGTIKITRDFLDAYDGPRAGETILTVLPLYHIFALTVNLLLFYAVGARNLLAPSPRPVSNLKAAFENFDIQWMTGVDTLYAGLLAEAWFQAKPPKLRFALSGGTALRPSTAQAWQTLVCPILEGYGMTETTCIVSSNPPTQVPHVGTVGLPMPGSLVRIVDSEGNDLGSGTPGELLVKGPQVVAGYLHAQQDSTSAFTDGWLHTGDIAQFEQDGYLRIVDRKKDLILVSGFNVYPNEVEDVLAAHPDIVEAAVIGIPDDRSGEAVQAFVVRKHAHLDEVAVEDYCRTQLTAYKVPKQIRFVEQLPKSPVGKVLRAALRQTA